MKNWIGRTFGVALCCGVSSLALLHTGSIAVAQQKVVDFDIPGGSLGDVLTQIGAATSSPIAFSPQAVQGLNAGAIKGRMSVGQAVARALAGTRLRVVLSSSGTWTVSGGGGAKAVDGIKTDVPDIIVSGGGYADGSSDPLATEGTHTYAATAANIATKSNLPIKETPQSVSVVTAQQLEDEHITTLDQAVAATPGLITQTGGGESGSNLDTTYLSRGFAINSISIDGGSPLQVGGNGSGYKSSLISAFDLSEYDSVAVLRGSGGQYSGVGDPGGTLSLERKKPLDHMSESVDQTFSSFEGFRTAGDISTGNLLDGHLRIRSTFVNDDQHYFYEFAKKYVDQVYLNAELNFTPTTLINFGGSYNNTRANPWYNGLPTYPNGTFANFPRSFCLCASWGQTVLGTEEYFLQVKQDVGPDWHVHFNSSIQRQSAYNNNLGWSTTNPLTYQVGYGVQPKTYTGIELQAEQNSNKGMQELADLYVNGRLSPFGILLEPTVGGSIQSIVQTTTPNALGYDYDTYSQNILAYNGSQAPQVPLTKYTTISEYDAGTTPNYRQRQLAGYASLRISPTPWAHLLVAERVSSYDNYLSITSYGTTTSQNIRTMHVPIPDVGLTFDLTHETSIYGSYTTIYQLTQDLVSPNGGLAPPITGATWEGGIKRSDYGGKLTSSFAYYNASETNIPVLNPLYTFSQPAGSYLTCCYIADGTKYNSQGVDLEVNGKVLPNLDLTFSYNFNLAQTYNGPLAQAGTSASQGTAAVSNLNFVFPRHIIKLFGVWTPETHIAGLDQYTHRLKLGFGMDFRSTTSDSATYTTYTSTYPFIATTHGFDVVQHSYAVFNAMAKYDLTDHAFTQLNVYNLLDRRYYQTIGTNTGGNWYGQPLTFVGSLHVGF